MYFTSPLAGEVGGEAAGWGREGSIPRPQLVHNSLTSPGNHGIRKPMNDKGGESQMRRGFGVLGVTVTVILLIIVAAIGYNIGWSQGVGTHLPVLRRLRDPVVPADPVRPVLAVPAGVLGTPVGRLGLRTRNGLRRPRLVRGAGAGLAPTGARRAAAVRQLDPTAATA